MKTLLVLVLLGVIAPVAMAATCTYTGYKRTCRGWFWARTCSTNTVTLYRSCPAVHGGWSDWGSWTAVTNCTVLCGGGDQDQTRHRTCTNPAPQYGGNSCSGHSQEDRTVHDCNNEPCIVHGGWSDWGSWTAVTNCTVLCGAGDQDQTRHRTCTNPAPQNGGNSCSGHSQEDRTVHDCNNEPCSAYCTNGGGIQYVAAPNDPRYFYQCVFADPLSSTRAFLHMCAEGTVWDQSTTICVMATTTTPSTTTPSTTTTSASCVHGTMKAKHPDCRFYTVCVHGTAVEMDCGVGLHFDDVTKVCNFANLVTC
ncbi:uncharacterized protein LOC143288583 isoform X2 [Babylonia areolata]|uniref:uncharacterized protein LOC143288583 isoform X2 n=1 Tax=Babylonia areolata TaxID=304850 RepID=UPI003FD40FF2